jgi:hypothetical protein
MDALMTSTSGAPLDTLEPLTTEHDEIGGAEAGVDVDAPVPFTPVHPLAGIDEELDAELAAMGVELTPGVEEAMAEERRQGMAAVLLRRAGREDAAIAELQGTMELQLAAIRACYERQIAPHAARRDRYLQHVELVAELTPWKKRKSAITPFGTYGVRDTSATVEVTDRKALAEHALTALPGFVRIDLQLPLAEAKERFSDDEIKQRGKVDVEWGKLKSTLDVDGTLPPGVIKVDAARTAYAKATPITVEG